MARRQSEGDLERAQAWDACLIIGASHISLISSLTSSFIQLTFREHCARFWGNNKKNDQPLPSRSLQSGETDNLEIKSQHSVIILLEGAHTRPRGSTQKGEKTTEGKDGR